MALLCEASLIRIKPLHGKAALALRFCHFKLARRCFAALWCQKKTEEEADPLDRNQRRGLKVLEALRHQTSETVSPVCVRQREHKLLWKYHRLLAYLLFLPDLI